MSLWDGLIAIGVVLGIGAIVFAKLAKNNPVAANTLRNFMPTKLYEKMEENSQGERVEQVWDDKRTMM